jgi:hypothetical protein
MPVLHLQLSTSISDEIRHQIQCTLTEVIASVMDKPIRDVMVIADKYHICMGGDFNPAVFIDIKCVGGLHTEIARILCTKIGSVLNNLAGIELSRMYFNFSLVSSEHAWRFIDGIAVSAAK